MHASGSYAVVYDNTGYIGSVSSSTVTVSDEISFYNDPSVDPLIDTITILPGDYNYHVFSFTSSNSMEKIGFEISSTEKVSLFVSTDNERSKFENEVSAYFSSISEASVSSKDASVSSELVSIESERLASILLEEQAESRETLFIVVAGLVFISFIALIIMKSRRPQIPKY